MIISAPDRTEYADYYRPYVETVTGQDIMRVLERQLGDVMPILESVSEERSLHRYAPDKWSMRELLNHVNDTERLFSFRAFWFARGFEDPLPSFDQDVAVTRSGADDRSWRSHLDELRAIRAATLSLFGQLPDDAWMRRGVASGNPFTVRALAYICAGHCAHHVLILKERYLPG